MDLNQAITILIEASIKAQKNGVYTVYESRDIANAMDLIEQLSQSAPAPPTQQEEKKREQPAPVPPVAPLNNVD